MLMIIGQLLEFHPCDLGRGGVVFLFVCLLLSRIMQQLLNRFQ